MHYIYNLENISKEKLAVERDLFTDVRASRLPVYRLFHDPISGAVFCVCIDPMTSQLVASGGEDDKAYVWKASNGEVLLECSGKLR